MAEDIEVAINASPSAPKIIEIDAAVIARIIMKTAHASPRQAAKAANAIVDYLVVCHQEQRSVS